MLYLFTMPTPSAFLSLNYVEIWVKLAEKFDFDLSSLHQSINPLEDLAQQFLQRNSHYLKKPQTPDDEMLHSIFVKLLAFYMLSKRLSNALRTEETDYFLNMIKGELEYLLTDIENNDFIFSYSKELNEQLIKNIDDCLNRLNTIIQLPIIPLNNVITDFAHRDIHDITMADINNVLFQLLYEVNDDFIQDLSLASLDDWFHFCNTLNDQGISLFYEGPQPHYNIQQALKCVFDRIPELNEFLKSLEQQHPFIFHILTAIVYCQYLLSFSEITIKDPRFLDFKKTIEQSLSFDFINVHTTLDEGTAELMLHKIFDSLEYMSAHGILLRTKSILEKELQEINLNAVLDTLNDLTYELTNHDNEPNEANAFYQQLYQFIINQPTHLPDYTIPIPAIGGPQKHLQETFLASFPEQKEQYRHFAKHFPLLNDLVAIYYLSFSLAIYPQYISDSRMVVYLYENFRTIICNTRYHEFFVGRSEYFLEALIKIHDYLFYLCDESTVNAFIIRAMELGFSTVATFAQGTREYFEQEDGLCAGYVYQMAEYMLIDKSDNTHLSKRSLRWNTQSHPSPFNITHKSPYRSVIANQRTFDFQSKPLIEVTDALQMVPGTSMFRFHSGAEIAEKLIEMMNEYPNAILLLGMVEKGEKIGHATACFNKEGLLHFFCATHSWVTTPQTSAKSVLHAFLYWIYSELSFFQQYTHFWVDIIYRTWEAPPLDDKHFHSERDENLMPYAYLEPVATQLQESAIALIQDSLARSNEILRKNLGLY